MKNLLQGAATIKHFLKDYDKFALIHLATFSRFLLISRKIKKKKIDQKSFQQANYSVDLTFPTPKHTSLSNKNIHDQGMIIPSERKNKTCNIF